jgi:hypothetical protein
LNAPKSSEGHKNEALATAATAIVLNSIRGMFASALLVLFGGNSSERGITYNGEKRRMQTKYQNSDLPPILEQSQA